MATKIDPVHLMIKKNKKKEKVKILIKPYPEAQRLFS